MTLHRKPLSLWVQERAPYDFDGSLDQTAEFISNLPGLDTWVPANDGSQVLSVLALGAALGRIDQTGCEQLLRKIAGSIESIGHPHKEDAAELNSAALLSIWSSNVRGVATKKGLKTPDFEAEIGGVTVEFEVTNSEQKLHQANLQTRALDFVQQLQAVVLVKGLRVRFSDEISESEFQDMISQAAQLWPGAVRESVGRWYMRAYNSPIQPDPTDANPSWWPQQHAQPALLQSSVQVDFSSESQQADIRSAVEVQWCLSTKSYLNSLSKKEGAEQASGTRPFIVLCDVTQLPGAFGWYADNFPSILATWSQRLTAVILFRKGITGLDSLQFEYRVHLNTNAQHRVPIPLSVTDRGELTIPFNSTRRA